MAMPPMVGKAVWRPQLYNYPVLPCLYDTATIRRSHSESRASRATKSRVGGASTASRQGTEGEPTTKQDRKFSSISSRSADYHGHNSSRQPTRTQREGNASSIPTRFSDRRASRMSDIPFELPDSVLKPAAPIGGTISDPERKAFERLYKIAAAKKEAEEAANAAKTKLESGAFDSLDDLLNEAITEIDAERDIPVRTSTREKAQQAAFARVATAFRTARTDFDLWKILEKEVFEPVAALNLDRPQPDQPRDASKVPSPRELLMHNFPQLVAEACCALRGWFPSSALPLSIIPALKHLGPSAYALGASTGLYNQVMGHMYRTLNDMDGILALLQEMENEAIEPDEKTLNTLDHIELTWQRIQMGEYGYATRVTWEADRYRRTLMAIMQWRDRIRTAVQRDVARKAARDKERADNVAEPVSVE